MVEVRFVPEDAAGRAQASKWMRNLVDPLHSTEEPKEVPTGDWHREIIDRHNAVVASGEGANCPHVTRGQAVLAAAWLPGLLVCPPCAGNALEPVGEVDIWTCDRCGQHLPGQIAVSAVQSGHVVIFVGLCRECRTL